MKPQSPPKSDLELFQSELGNMIEHRHDLVKLANMIDWDFIESKLSGYFKESIVGHPPLPIRLVAGLLILKEVRKLSDEVIVSAWLENPYFQYFTGEQYFQTKFPCDPTSLVRWRARIGSEGMEVILQASLIVGFRVGQLNEQSCAEVIVDSTVMNKAIKFPTDSNLINKIRMRMVEESREEGIKLRQNYNRLAIDLMRKISGYGHARQYKRMQNALKKLKNYTGRVYRDMLRHYATKDQEMPFKIKELLTMANKLLTQSRESKDKLYALHAPEVACIAKGKAQISYEFGAKVGIAISNKTGYVLSAIAFAGNPHDSKTLKEQLDHSAQMTGIKPAIVSVDRGYRGHGLDTTITKVLIAGTRGLKGRLKHLMRRRSAIEPAIGHMKSDGHLGRNYLKGAKGDKINAIAAAFGHNFRLLLNFFKKKLSLDFFYCWFFTSLPLKFA